MDDCILTCSCDAVQFRVQIFHFDFKSTALRFQFRLFGFEFGIESFQFLIGCYCIVAVLCQFTCYLEESSKQTRENIGPCRVILVLTDSILKILDLGFKRSFGSFVF